MTLSAHPYANQWRLLDGDSLDALSDDVAANGLHEPIVTFDGQIADGRNRYAACQAAGVEPHFREFDGTEDELLAFIESANAHRRHDTPGQVAASRALMYDTAGLREGGRWKRQTVRPANGQLSISDGEVKSSNRAGLILDHLGRAALEQVRDGDRSLYDAYTEAQEARDVHLRKVEDERIAAEAEAKAERFMRDTAPDLAELVGSTYETWTEAEAVWRVRNAEEAKALADSERKERDRVAAVEKGIKDALGHISNAIQFLDGGTTEGQKFLRDYLPHHDEHLSGARAITSERVDAAIDYLTTIRKELE